jgi:hypothetical protein
MLSAYGDDSNVLNLYLMVLEGFNKCKNDNMVFYFLLRLCSGLPWTSTINSFLNLVLTSYCVCNDNDLSVDAVFQKFLNLKIVIEGDDSLTEAPLEDEERINNNFNESGAICKIQYFKKVTEASFCGILADSQLNMCTNPLKFLCNFFVIPIKYSKSKFTKKVGLLHAKSFSYFYQYPKCPIVSILSWAFHVRYRKYRPLFNLLESDFLYKFDGCPTTPDFIKNQPVVPQELRIIVEKQFGVPVNFQLLLEEAIIKYAHGGPLEWPYHDCLEKYLKYGDEHLVPFDFVDRPMLHDTDWVNSPNSFGCSIELLPFIRHNNGKFYFSPAGVAVPPACNSQTTMPQPTLNNFTEFDF